MKAAGLTFDLVDSVRAAGRLLWRGQWQIDVVHHIIRNFYCTLQGPSQFTGKSFCLSLILAAGILLGVRTVIAMPTLRQGGRILMREALKRIVPFERALGDGLKRTVNNTLEVVWSNGAVLMCLSADDAAQKGIEGYTFHWLVWDEAHGSTKEQLAVFLSRLGVAVAEGTARVILLGIIPEIPDALIDVMQQEPANYKPIVIDDERIMRDAPRYRAGLETYKRQMPTNAYLRFYGMKRVPLTGMHYILPGLAREGKPRFLGGRSAKTLGVDIGRTSDRTVCTVFERAQGLTIWHTPLILPQDMDTGRQAAEIAALAREEGIPSRDCAIEYNGVGVGVGDVLKFGLPGVMAAPMADIQVVTLDYEVKYAVLELMGREARDAELICPDTELHGQLSKLGYKNEFSKRELPVRVWDHSDELSSGIMAKCATLSIGSAA